jgi:hypothetical protein
VQSHTGFPLAGAADATQTPLPTASELESLAEIDGLALRELEFRRTRDAAAERLASVHS